MSEAARASMSDAAKWADALSAIAVIGAGTMGEGIAQSFAEAGLSVRLIDIFGAALERCRAQIARNLAQARAAGLAGTPVATILDRIEFVVADDPATAVGDVGLVIESAPESLELKRALFAALDALGPDVVIASNTSSLTMSPICAGLATAGRMVGLHYFNPAHLIPAVEIHRGAATTDVTVARARAVLERSGKVPMVIEKELPGLVINRLTGALMREIYDLLDGGVISPADLDAGVRASLGFRMAWMGPMEAADFTGLDIGLRVVSELLPNLSTRTEPPQMLRDKVARGDLGVKSGRGWLDHGGRDRATLLDDRNARLLRQVKAMTQPEGGTIP